jgi:hypothetical protein
MSKEKRCGTCAFWTGRSPWCEDNRMEPERREIGHCHRRSPDSVAHWPQTIAMDSCGDFERYVNDSPLTNGPTDAHT